MARVRKQTDGALLHLLLKLEDGELQVRDNLEVGGVLVLVQEVAADGALQLVLVEVTEAGVPIALLIPEAPGGQRRPTGEAHGTCRSYGIRFIY
jgi:hypothetical protein